MDRAPSMVVPSKLFLHTYFSTVHLMTNWYSQCRMNYRLSKAHFLYHGLGHLNQSHSFEYLAVPVDLGDVSPSFSFSYSSSSSNYLDWRK